MGCGHSKAKVQQQEYGQVLAQKSKRSSEKNSNLYVENSEWLSDEDATTDTTTAGSGLEFSTFEIESLAAHNVYRRMHGVQPLRLSKELCMNAQMVAQQLADTNVFEQNDEQPMYRGLLASQNIAQFHPNGLQFIKGAEPAQKWYSQISDYDFSRPGYRTNGDSLNGNKMANGPTDFVSMIWKKSIDFGTGIASTNTGDSTKFIVVSQYHPGNYLRCKQIVYEENVNSAKCVK